MSTTTPEPKLVRRLGGAFRRPPAPPAPPPAHSRLEDFLGGRALAWAGGVATLLGIVLLLALAISHGWIGPLARVILAGGASAILMAGGAWLHARHGRTEAALAMVGTATAGGFATLIVAADVYRLIPPALALGGSMVVGALATAMAIRWAGRAIAGLGLIGALVSPILVGAPSDAVTIAMLAVGAACATWVVLWRRWTVLAFAAVLVPAPQWAVWVLRGHSVAVELAVLGVFGAVGLLASVFAQVRSYEDDALALTAAALALLNAVLIGVIGRITLGEVPAGAWLIGVAIAYAGVGLARRIAIHETLRRLLIATGVICLDAALALLAHGLVLSAAYGAGAVTFAWLVRRRAGGVDEPWLGLAVGEHVGFVLARGLIELPPSSVLGSPSAVSLGAVAILAATCLGSARIGPERPVWRGALDVLGLVAIAYVTLAALDGAALIGAWALEAVALAGLARRRGIDERVCRYGALAFLGASTLYTLVLVAPPNALVTGVDSLGQAAIALAALAAAMLLVAVRAEGGSRRALFSGSAVTMLYLASVAIISAFQPAGGTATDVVLDLGVRQQGQVLLSGLWGIVGVSGLIAGLRRNWARVRIASLALLFATVAKVFLYDLSTLTSIYRVASFLVLGGLLLAGAFAYQRLRPPPPPDMRTLHPSQR